MAEEKRMRREFRFFFSFDASAAALSVLDVGEQCRQRNSQRPSSSSSSSQRRIQLRGGDQAPGTQAPRAADLGLHFLPGRERGRKSDNERASVNGRNFFSLPFVSFLSFRVRERRLPEPLPGSAVTEARAAPCGAEATVAEAGGSGEAEGGARRRERLGRRRGAYVDVVVAAAASRHRFTLWSQLFFVSEINRLMGEKEADREGRCEKASERALFFFRRSQKSE